MTKLRLFFFFSTLLVVATLAYLISLYARGFRYDSQKKRLSPQGLLVIKSIPDGAQVYLNDELKTATNANLSLAPGNYQVSIKKEGFHDWNKELAIEKEIVTEAEAHLFRLVPSLSPVTFAGAENPLQSEDLTKIIFSVPKNGLWLIETVNLPIGFSRDPRQITDGDLKNSSWQFSPNNREILLETPTGKFLLDSTTFTAQAKRTSLSQSAAKLSLNWQQEKDKKLQSLLKNLPEKLTEIINRSGQKISFSPDETKILYQIKEDETLAENLIKPLLGISTQKEERTLKKGHFYVYDIKEDRNFLIEENAEAKPGWYSTSKHILIPQSDKVLILDYDGTNRQEIYSGSYSSPSAFATANPERIIILTNLGANSSPANLYSLSLK